MGELSWAGGGFFWVETGNDVIGSGMTIRERNESIARIEEEK